MLMNTNNRLSPYHIIYGMIIVYCLHLLFMFMFMFKTNNVEIYKRLTIVFLAVFLSCVHHGFTILIVFGIIVKILLKKLLL